MDVPANSSFPSTIYDDHITWLLDHPGSSDWLKATLRSGRECDPIILSNDLQLLSFVLGRRAEAQIRAVLQEG